MRNNNLATIAIVIPEGVDFRLGSKITVQGHEVDCLTIAWESNSIRQASALEQRLEVAMDILENDDIYEKDLRSYNARLKEMEDSGELIEMED